MVWAGCCCPDIYDGISKYLSAELIEKNGMANGHVLAIFWAYYWYPFPGQEA